ncbi:MAG: hypothetical protein HQK49_15085 [Oligoflexia bacterium]|nr:hypothetical protein [Oligoflexia bacterium]
MEQKTELLAVVLEESKLTLEWSREESDPTLTTLNKDTLELQEESMKRFADGNYNKALLFLGFFQRIFLFLPL